MIPGGDGLCAGATAWRVAATLRRSRAARRGRGEAVITIAKPGLAKAVVAGTTAR